VSAGGVTTGTWVDAVTTDGEALMNTWRAAIGTRREVATIGVLVGIALATIGTKKVSAAIGVLVGVALGDGVVGGGD
jgi:hypothetical protein